MAGFGAEKKLIIELTGGITFTGLDWLSPSSPVARTVVLPNHVDFLPSRSTTVSAP
jgi:hypothetical protein